MVFIISSPCESTGEDLDAGNDHPDLGAGDGGLEVLCEATVASEPCKRALHHPASGLGLERSNGLGSSDDFNRPLAEVGDRVEQLRSAIDAVGKDVAQFWEHSSDGSQQRYRPVIVLNIGGLHEDGEQRALGVGNDVALAALDLLGHVKPAWAAAFCGLGTLAVDDAC